MKQLFKGLVVAGAICLTGCAISLSEHIAPQEVFGTLKVSGGDDGVTCEAIWTVGGAMGTYIELSGADRVSCNDGAREVTMTKEGFFGEVSYEASGLSYIPQGTYAIVLRKADATYTSTVTLPPPLSISSPIPSQQVRKGIPMIFNWNAGGSDGLDFHMGWSDGTTYHSETESTGSDSGHFESSPGFTSATKLESPILGMIPASVTVTRRRRGTFAVMGLNGGSIEGFEETMIPVSLVD